MRTRTFAALAALALVPLAACGSGPDPGPATQTRDQSYDIAEPFTALVVDAQAARVTVEAGDGPGTVTETHRYGDQPPTTTHQVDGSTLRLSQTGCGDNGTVRCEVEYKIRVPAATTTEITAAAGGVTLVNLAGDVTVTTQAGAVEGSGLAADQVVIATKAGATSLVFAEAPALVRATTDLGAVELKLPGEQTYAVDVGQTVGGSKVTVPRDDASAHRIEVRTQLGAVSIAPS
jgi:hypothetical protein